MSIQNTVPQPLINIHHSKNLWHWLNEAQISLAFTTYQTNRLFLLGCKSNEQLAVNERLFDRPMGLYTQNNSLYMACRYQIWQLENRLATHETYQGADRLYTPSISYITGDLNVHDVVMTQAQKLLFINTNFSCLATLKAGFNFEPLWQPPFISKLVAEDRCHLNGLAMKNNEPTYVTACSSTNEAAGWRNHRTKGGIVMHIPSNEIIATGLSMPHSPRWYRGKLWLLNSGTGELGYLEGEQFIALTFCQGFPRGLAFQGDYAIVGISKLRSKNFSGLALEQRFLAENKNAFCGLVIIDLRSGEIVHWLQINSVVEELFDVVILPKVRLPRAVGFQNDDINRLVTFPNSGGIVTTKPTVKRQNIGQATQPRALQSTLTDKPEIIYQRIHHLSPENLVPYDAMTYPSLQTRWKTQPQRGELLGISASIAGEMIGFAVAERFAPVESAQTTTQLLSLFVLTEYGNRAIDTTLINYLQQWINTPLMR